MKNKNLILIIDRKSRKILNSDPVLYLNTSLKSNRDGSKNDIRVLSDDKAVYTGITDSFKAKTDFSLIYIIGSDLPFVKPAQLEKCERSLFSSGADVVFLANEGNAVDKALICVKPEIFSDFIKEKKSFKINELIGFFEESERKIMSTFVRNELELTSIDENFGYYSISKAISREINSNHISNGVFIFDIDSVIIEYGVEIGRGTVIYPACVLEGSTKIGENCIITQGSKLSNMILANDVSFESSVGLDSEVGEGTHIGPFAYIRPNSVIGKNCKIGDFVEVKNATIGNGSKASHLAYIGDADVGEKVNFSCGAIISNYDGKNKTRTIIEDGCFIGCNTNLISPVKIGKGAYTAAGSTITDDVPEANLAIARARQVNKSGWKRPEKIDQ